jgi:hypothetical protein
MSNGRQGQGWIRTPKVGGVVFGLFGLESGWLFLHTKKRKGVLGFR